MTPAPGARHAGLPVVWHEAYEVDIGPHVFPTAKYRLVRERLAGEAAVEFHRPEPVTDDEVRLVHTATYVGKILEGRLSLDERLALEVPFSAELQTASWLCAGGAVLTARLAQRAGVAVHLGGGFHHAFPDHGEGFCLINDVAIAIRVLQRGNELRRALVLDCDVHHGNGTAAVFAGDEDVFTFSIHQEHNYPSYKPPSDVDIGLEDGAGDDEYLGALASRVPPALDGHRPDLVWYLAGADPYRNDQLGGLALTVAGLRRRDELVLGCCGERRIPVAVALAGGYARHPEDTIEIHCNTARLAVRSFTGTSLPS